MLVLEVMVSILKVLSRYADGQDKDAITSEVPIEPVKLDKFLSLIADLGLLKKVWRVGTG